MVCSAISQLFGQTSFLKLCSMLKNEALTWQHINNQELFISNVIVGKKCSFRVWNILVWKCSHHPSIFFLLKDAVSHYIQFRTHTATMQTGRQLFWMMGLDVSIVRGVLLTQKKGHETCLVFIVILYWNDSCGAKYHNWLEPCPQE